MLVYPGDHIHTGQLLVVLDNAESEYAAKAQQAKFQALAASHDVGIARHDYLEKSGQYKATVDTQTAAQKALEAAQANLDYWQTEIQREQVLLSKDVVSKQEFDNEFAQFSEAQAKVAEAQANARAATENKMAMQQAAAGMHEHIHHKEEEAAAANADAQQASVIQSYTRIVASEEGVVTKRDVSPGVVVSPGTRIMRIAHLNKVRAQAEVASTDVDKINVGAPVDIKSSSASSTQVHAHITAKFPAADPASRTTILEALVPNRNYGFLPGQYVVMSITTGSKDTLTVPTSAVVWSGQRAQVWKAVGSQQPLIAQLTDVQIGLANDTRTEIKSGMRLGDQVIFQGQTGLAPGASVIAVKWGESGPSTLPTGSQAAGNRLGVNNNWTSKFSINNIAVIAFMKPVPLKPNANQLLVEMRRADGSALTGATVTAKTNMPTMSMPGPDLQAKEISAGTYQFDANFMSTLWEVLLKITPQKGQASELKLDVEVP
jgi:RND family efflux transporter MFP subunit